MSTNKSALASRLGSALVFHFISVSIGLSMLYPILWMVSSSFKESSQVFIEAASLIPRHFTLENYVQGWAGFGDVSFARFFVNSIVVSGLATLGELVSTTLAAYGFARIRFIGRKLLFGVMIATLMLPFQVIMIPQYILFRTIHWTNSFKPLIVPHFFAMTPFFVFLTMQFIRGLPKDLDEAAIIAGCGRYGILIRITLPLIVPALVTVTIFSFYWRWQEFLPPLLFINSVSRYTVALGLKLFSDPASNTDWGAIFAMGTLSLIPVAIVFFAFQRFFVEGISISGLKG
jgi:multiple sugar transport system permease protein